MNSHSLAARLVRRFSLLAAVSALTAGLFAQSEPTPAAGDAAQGDRRARRQNGDRPNFNPEDMQQRYTQALRDQLGITDDAEWKLISERAMAVMELRRATMGAGMGGFAGFRGAGGPGQAGQAGRAGRGGSPEQDALRQAVVDKLPDAEIKSRLTRLREVRKANEEKLSKAQEELRAVLTVRQEAVAVVFGLLP